MYSFILQCKFIFKFHVLDLIFFPILFISSSGFIIITLDMLGKEIRNF